jgi:hypothetical protein
MKNTLPTALFGFVVMIAVGVGMTLNDRPVVCQPALSDPSVPVAQSNNSMPSSVTTVEAPKKEVLPLPTPEPSPSTVSATVPDEKIQRQISTPKYAPEPEQVIYEGEYQQPYPTRSILRRP